MASAAAAFLLVTACSKSPEPANARQRIALDAIRAAERNDLTAMKPLATNAAFGEIGETPGRASAEKWRTTLAPGTGEYQRDCKLSSLTGGADEDDVVWARWTCEATQGHDVHIRFRGGRIIALGYLVQL